MRLRFVFTVVTTIAVAISGPAEAQENRSDFQSVVVQLDDTATVLKGRLVSLDADTVTLLVKKDRISLPLNRVVRITARRRDSVWNGAIIGALIGGALCARNCGQGLDHAGELPLAVASAAGLWGAAGAALDAMNRREEVLYERGRSR